MAAAGAALVCWAVVCMLCALGHTPGRARCQGAFKLKRSPASPPYVANGPYTSTAPKNLETQLACCSGPTLPLSSDTHLQRAPSLTVNMLQPPSVNVCPALKPSSS